MNLFEHIESQNRGANEPLASRMRPRTLDEMAGQDHILGEGKLLRRLVQSRQINSVILYGPPGTGKTTLAKILASEVDSKFRTLSAVSASVKDVREVLAWAADEISVTGKRPVLFLDEIHRFNRGQQDALLPDVEAGTITLIGATTSNPFFAINDALLSRSQLFELRPLEASDIAMILQNALADRQRGLGNMRLTINDPALRFLSSVVEGDARRALGALEIAALSLPKGKNEIDENTIQESIQRKVIRFDRTGDEHYDLASALIKSIRGSDVDAALYWLACALESGEDVRFLCRRLIILASEDIGNADPHALTLAVSAMQACEFIGLPEAQLTLSQCVIYLSLAPKSNSATSAIGAARKEVREGKLQPVPHHLRDSHYSGAKQMGIGAEYKYAHDYDEGIAPQQYMDRDVRFYGPTSRGFESEMTERLRRARRRLGREDQDA
jgi:putative ATPase